MGIFTDFQEKVAKTSANDIDVKKRTRTHSFTDVFDAFRQLFGYFNDFSLRFAL
jgi:hypothetical protein